MQPKPLRLLGLAKRAGKIACGMDAVEEAAGQAHAVFLASDAGQAVRRGAKRYGNRASELPYGKEELGRAVGRESCAVAAVIDEKFSQGIIEALQMEES